MTTKYAKDQPAGYKNSIRNVAIIGAGGQIGKHILKALLDKGTFAITAIQRPNSTSTSTLSPSLKVLEARYGGSENNDSELVTALQGQQVLIVTMAVSAPPDTVARISRAAASAGVPYVFPNWFGHDVADESLGRDNLLRPAGDAIIAEFQNFGGKTEYILLTCNFWYEFSLGGGPDRYGFDFRNRKVIWFDDGLVKINTSTWPQCGRAVVSALSLKVLPEDERDTEPTLSRFGNGAIYISSFRISQRDMFESVKRVTGTVDGDWSFEHETAEQRVRDGMEVLQKGTGDMAAFAKVLYSRMFYPNGDGEYESKRGLDNEILGLPAEDLDEFTKIAVGFGESGEILERY